MTYGDYNANTGPIDVIAVTPQGAAETLLPAFDTEQVDCYRVLNDGWVWAPSKDPRGGNPGSLATNFGGQWHVVSVTVPGLPVVEHMFDVSQEPNGDLFVCGSRSPDTAFVWQSRDSGGTWSEVVTHATGKPDGIRRFYRFDRVGGALAVASNDGSGWFVLNNNRWHHLSIASPDPALDRHVYVDDDCCLIDTQAGRIGTMPGPAWKWSASLAGDESIWLSDGADVYLLSPPT